MGMHMHIIIMERDCIRRILLLIIGIESYYNAEADLCQPLLQSFLDAPSAKAYNDSAKHTEKTGD